MPFVPVLPDFPNTPRRTLLIIIMHTLVMFSGADLGILNCRKNTFQGLLLLGDVTQNPFGYWICRKRLGMLVKLSNLSFGSISASFK